jgi:hypothetical protein
MATGQTDFHVCPEPRASIMVRSLAGAAPLVAIPYQVRVRLPTVSSWHTLLKRKAQLFSRTSSLWVRGFSGALLQSAEGIAAYEDSGGLSVSQLWDRCSSCVWWLSRYTYVRGGGRYLVMAGPGGWIFSISIVWAVVKTCT